MKRRIMLGMAAALLGFSTACEEINKVVPQEASQKPEELPKEVPPTEDAEEEDIQETEPISGITKYVIREGEQHATLSYQSVAVEKLKFKALFDSSAIYQTALATNQGDINKLYGISDCESYHHTNSARFGWRWYKDKLEVWAYTYINGERKFALMDTVGLETFNEYEIEFRENKYVFRLNDKKLEMPRACVATAKGYKLFPYFGGDEVAPQDISIWIEELKD